MPRAYSLSPSRMGMPVLWMHRFTRATPSVISKAAFRLGEKALPEKAEPKKSEAKDPAAQGAAASRQMISAANKSFICFPVFVFLFCRAGVFCPVISVTAQG